MNLQIDNIMQGYCTETDLWSFYTRGQRIEKSNKKENQDLEGECEEVEDYREL